MKATEVRRNRDKLIELDNTVYRIQGTIMWDGERKALVTAMFGAPVSLPVDMKNLRPECLLTPKQVLIETFRHEPVRFVQFITRKGALKLQSKGIKVSRGPSVLSICKKEYGFKGNSASVYLQMQEITDTVLKANKLIPVREVA